MVSHGRHVFVELLIMSFPDDWRHSHDHLVGSSMAKMYLKHGEVWAAIAKHEHQTSATVSPHPPEKCELK